MADSLDTGAPFPLPRVTIKFCTHICKFAQHSFTPPLTLTELQPLFLAQYAQELLSTFSNALGEVALQPSTGGTFTVEILHHHHHHSAAPRASTSTSTTAQPGSWSAPGPGGDAVPQHATAAVARTVVLWDRKADGGFPETKELKRRVRDVIEPGRDLGHVDRDHHRPKPAPPPAAAAAAAAAAEASKDAEVQPQQQESQDGKPQQAAGGAGACEDEQECKDCD